VLRIRDVYPGFKFFSIPDPRSEFFHSDPRSAYKILSILTPKKWFLSSRIYDPGCASRIRILTHIPDPGSILDPQHCLKCFSMSIGSRPAWQWQQTPIRIQFPRGNQPTGQRGEGLVLLVQQQLVTSAQQQQLFTSQQQQLCASQQQQKLFSRQRQSF
jgi:hypothetical protein